MVTLVLEAARDQVPVAIDGKKRKISKAQAAAINLANAAATGNRKFVLQFIDLIARSTRGGSETFCIPFQRSR